MSAPVQSHQPQPTMSPIMTTSTAYLKMSDNHGWIFPGPETSVGLIESSRCGNTLAANSSNAIRAIARPVITKTRELALSASGTVAPANEEIPPTTDRVVSDETKPIMNTSMTRS